MWWQLLCLEWSPHLAEAVGLFLDPPASFSVELQTSEADLPHMTLPYLQHVCSSHLMFFFKLLLHLILFNFVSLQGLSAFAILVLFCIQTDKYLYTMSKTVFVHMLPKSLSCTKGFSVAFWETVKERLPSRSTSVRELHSSDMCQHRAFCGPARHGSGRPCLAPGRTMLCSKFTDGMSPSSG